MPAERQGVRVGVRIINFHVLVFCRELVIELRKRLDGILVFILLEIILRKGYLLVQHLIVQVR